MRSVISIVSFVCNVPKSDRLSMICGIAWLKSWNWMSTIFRSKRQLPEQLGFEGREEGVSAYATVLVYKLWKGNSLIVFVFSWFYPCYNFITRIFLFLWFKMINILKIKLIFLNCASQVFIPSTLNSWGVNIGFNLKFRSMKKNMEKVVTMLAVIMGVFCNCIS